MIGKVIITADDYGMCPEVNEAIEDCLAAGVLGATCVMTNMPVFEDATRLRKRFPKSSIGIHWNLTQGKPVLSPLRIPSLVGSNGEFQPASLFRRNWLWGRINPAELIEELRAQTNRLVQVAGPPEFWNTHENCHVLPGLFQACVNLGQELGIPAMRCHRRFTVVRDCLTSSFNIRHPLFWLKGQVVARWAQRAESQGVRMTDGRVYMFGYEVEESDIRESLRKLPWSTVNRALELVIHPSTKVVRELFGTVAEKRVLEYKVFKNPNLLESLRNIGVEAVGFEALKV